jgi:hypothetical protein
MSGMKFKVAHKRADTEKWSGSERAQRRRLIKFLEETIHELQQQEAAPPAAGQESPSQEPPDKQPALRRAKKTPPPRQRKAVAA